jgi:hypothetical protein
MHRLAVAVFAFMQLSGVAVARSSALPATAKPVQHPPRSYVYRNNDGYYTIAGDDADFLVGGDIASHVPNCSSPLINCASPVFSSRTLGIPTGMILT